jgi:hypothetical protein
VIIIKNKKVVLIRCLIPIQQWSASLEPWISSITKQGTLVKSKLIHQNKQEVIFSLRTIMINLKIRFNQMIKLKKALGSLQILLSTITRNIIINKSFRRWELFLDAFSKSEAKGEHLQEILMKLISFIRDL